MQHSVLSLLYNFVDREACALECERKYPVLRCEMTESQDYIIGICVACVSMHLGLEGMKTKGGSV